ncbi:hypothetical protein TorRG33x02_103760 [Trema orientale]|uniref:Uncharacterized protein n=1 Tax=Trema orientale TaxID=63057 RepID=A0A2P5F896_TREOI|nr:hypothetical protein TorRG33x02_103760 [Trema orientale]
MGGAAAALAEGRSFREVEEVDLVVGEVEEGGAVGPAVVGMGEHQPWELRREVVWGLWDGGSPAPADDSESEIISVDCEVFGDRFDEFRRELGPVHPHFRGFDQCCSKFDIRVIYII